MFKYKISIIFLIISITLKSQIPVSGLIAYYPFNGNTIDESGNGNNGAINGATLTLDRCNIPNSAYYYDGNSSIINLPPNKLMLDVYTWSVWIKVASFPPSSIDGWIIFAVGSGDSPWQQAMSIHPDGGLVGGSYNIGSNPTGSWIKSNPIEKNKWYHMVFTRDMNRLKIYVNGEYNVNLSIPYNDIINNQKANYGSTTYTAIIGCRSNYTSYNHFLGSIDDLIIYNRVLTDEEIRNLYKTNCPLSPISGSDAVCQGQKNVNYAIQPYNGFTNYNWSYNGTGMTISGNSNSIMADFADNATSGILTVTLTDNTFGTQTTKIPITVNQIPFNAGKIIGKADVCTNQNGVNYSIPLINNVTNYTWNYSGTGVSIIGTSNNININFSQNATNGILTVAGSNICGTGAISELPVKINHLPSNDSEIIGSHEVCANQGNSVYTIPIINGADNYIWNYTGTGATILGTKDSISIYFFNNATSGNLIVYGNNICGIGSKSIDFPIIVKSCTDYPAIQFNIPNAFTPNGDGINDVFFIKGLVEYTKVMVFDRFGKIVYESGNYLNNWDGKDNEGRLLETGTYWYVIIVPGMPSEYKGFVYLKK